ncbi:ABC transporter ATP-binding protein [Criibacterium bergeronii]|uniref:ABC transporter ATP-binding protein n=1 Tax=Criibacterium bergeronii TaxID=1871336 RepID=UPI001A9C09B9|nr:ABC transporter ATP-binding protein [Criibacterium bergeronii]
MEKLNLLENVSLNFDEIRVFDNFSLSVPKEKITCILGPSGCGKTSILNMLAGLLNPAAGKVNVGKEKIGYIFQEDRLLPWETVYDNIRLVRGEENCDEILQILYSLEMLDFKDKYPSQLSGGMLKRVSLARGFYFEPSLMLMDESFKSLDYDLRLEQVKYLTKFWRKNKNTIIFVTHDIDEAVLLGHNIVILSGRITKIIDTYSLNSELEQRKLYDDEHIKLRNKIIKIIEQNH